MRSSVSSHHPYILLNIPRNVPDTLFPSRHKKKETHVFQKDKNDVSNRSSLFYHLDPLHYRGSNKRCENGGDVVVLEKNVSHRST